MKSKNHRQVLTDELWRPEIHDHQPIYQPVSRRSERKRARKQKAKCNKEAGRYMNRIKAKEPFTAKYSRSVLLKYVCRELGASYENTPEERAQAFKAYCKFRGYKGGNRRLVRAEFYESREWQKVRYQAIRLYGRKCQACGATDQQIHVDHIKPRSKYPELELELSNLQILCRDCNLGKGAWDETDWRSSETEQ